MQISVVQADATGHSTPALVVNLFEGVTAPGGATGAVDRALGGMITRLIASGEIDGKSEEVTVIHTPVITGGDSGVAAERVVVLGLGKREPFDLDAVRNVSAALARALRRLKVRSAATIVHGAGIGGLDAGDAAEAIAEGTLLGLYTFEKYRTPGDEPDSPFETLELIERDGDKIAAIENGINRGVTYGDAANLARDLVNEPPNVLNPTELAKRAESVCSAPGLSIEVKSEDECRKLGMGAYLSVAAGSDQPPRFIHITYEGDPSNPKNNIWLVGKGITFDSGGISLKPAASMVTMKGDMGGGAAVIGAMQAIGSLKPKINVHAVCAATENMPGPSATRPGDIVQAMNGKFIEVVNTDAEGRMTLADAICFARNNGAERIIDVATLTGAVSVALGKGNIGAFSNNSKFWENVRDAARRQGEPVWRLPLDPVSKRQNKTPVADIKNTGGRNAGSITAAHFIHEFAEDTPWVHLDIAAFNMSESVGGVNVVGATGASARLLVRLVENLAAR